MASPTLLVALGNLNMARATQNKQAIKAALADVRWHVAELTKAGGNPDNVPIPAAALEAAEAALNELPVSAPAAPVDPKDAKIAALNRSLALAEQERDAALMALKTKDTYDAHT